MCIRDSYLSEQSGGKVYLKPENMQHTGAYKIRGAYYKISTLSDEERGRGPVSYTHLCNLCQSAQRINLLKQEEIKEELTGR